MQNKKQHHRVILDVDTGSDDAVAIMLALRHPSIELLGVTTVHGNAPVDIVLDNTLRVIELAGARLPVLRGAERPLIRDDFPIPRAQLPERAVHAHPLPLPPTHARAAAGHAVDFLIDAVLSAPGTVSLVTTAPLTNLALALAREPRLAGAFREVLTLEGVSTPSATSPRPRTSTSGPTRRPPAQYSAPASPAICSSRSTPPNRRPSRRRIATPWLRLPTRSLRLPPS